MTLIRFIRGGPASPGTAIDPCPRAVCEWMKGGRHPVKVMTADIPPLDFEEAALKAIRAMKFRPIKRLGVPVKVTFERAIIFRS